MYNNCIAIVTYCGVYYVFILLRFYHWCQCSLLKSMIIYISLVITAKAAFYFNIFVLLYDRFILLLLTA